MYFCGQEQCRIDANSRLKLPPIFMRQFKEHGEQNVVLHCLPEGALGIYPASVWSQMRQHQPRPAAQAAKSIVFRRELRRFGALTQQQTITTQGRITVPAAFRERLALERGSEAILIGAEIGLEAWERSRWTAELASIDDHEQKRSESQMASDLTAEQ